VTGFDKVFSSFVFIQARVNVPCTSKATQHRKDKKSLFASTTNVQVKK